MFFIKWKFWNYFLFEGYFKKPIF